MIAPWLRLSNDAKLNLKMYRGLEENFIQITDYIPLDTDHYHVWSPRLIPLLHSACMEVESLFKQIAQQERFADVKDVASLKEKISKNDPQDYPDMRDYMEFGKILELYNREVHVRETNSFIMPFKEWESNGILAWWDSYNKVKHDRHIEYKEGNVLNVLYALGAVYTLNVEHLHGEKFHDLDILRDFESKVFSYAYPMSERTTHIAHGLIPRQD